MVMFGGLPLLWVRASRSVYLDDRASMGKDDSEEDDSTIGEERLIAVLAHWR